MRELIGYNKRVMPHIHSYTRLQSSETHGVGVFAICDIPEGTSIFRDDPAQMVVIDKSEIDIINPEFKKLYEDFCVRKSNNYLCPRSFNRRPYRGISIKKKRPQTSGAPATLTITLLPQGTLTRARNCWQIILNTATIQKKHRTGS
jgi:hypothetical protein